MSSVPRCITAADIATAADVIAGMPRTGHDFAPGRPDRRRAAVLRARIFSASAPSNFGAYNAIAQLSAEQRRAG